MYKGEIRGRSFTCALPAAALDAIQIGTLRNTYRGIPFLKDPFDVLLYQQLISRLKPRTVIEIGIKHGGSALWFADQLTAHGLAGRVIAVDIEPQVAFTDPRIEVLRGDALALGATLGDALLGSLDHPWLIVEDSAHRFDTTLAVMQFFDRHLQPDDYLVIEDGVLSSFTDPLYRRYEDGPNRAVQCFLSADDGRYAIDVSLCDHFGYNVTFNPNGWLRRL
jgi:cephalosporin hydroxylase